MDEGRKRTILIAASILAARDLHDWNQISHVNAMMITRALDKAEAILKEIDRRWPDKTNGGKSR
jgi:hypothetical protein